MHPKTGTKRPPDAKSGGFLVLLVAWYLRTGPATIATAEYIRNTQDAPQRTRTALFSPFVVWVVYRYG